MKESSDFLTMEDYAMGSIMEDELTSTGVDIGRGVTMGAVDPCGHGNCGGLMNESHCDRRRRRPPSIRSTVSCHGPHAYRRYMTRKGEVEHVASMIALRLRVFAQLEKSGWLVAECSLPGKKQFGGESHPQVGELGISARRKPQILPISPAPKM